MRRRTFLTLAGGTMLGSGTTALLLSAKPPTEDDAQQKATVPTAPKEIDVTNQARQYNSTKYAGPPTSFRSGHVTPRKLPKGSLKKKKDGFVIQLPSKTPVPTPAVYKGNVYVSGGFHSKEFYCVNAITGDLKWGFNLDDDGPSSAAAEDGVVVYNTESCTIFAHDAETGKLLWSFWLGDPLMSAPTIAGNRVFTSYPAAGRVPGGQQGAKKNKVSAKSAPPQSHAIACLDLKTGKILWQRWIDADVISAPVAVGTELFITTHRGTLYRLTQAEGKILSAKQVQATSSPTIAGGDVFYTKRTEKADGTRLEGIAAQGRSTGKFKRLVQTRTAPNIDPDVQREANLAGEGSELDQGNGFGGAFGGGDGGGFQGGGQGLGGSLGAAAANLGQGNVSTLQAYQGARVLHCPGSNISCLGGHAIVCTNPRTGDKLWEVKLKGDIRKEGGSLAAPPIVAGGQVFLSTLQGDVLQLDPKSGKLKKRYQTGSATRFQPAVVDGRIYVGTQDGKLVCIDTGNRKYTGWSMWGANAARTGTAEA